MNPQQAIDEIGTTAEMVFREGSSADGDVILTGDQVESATAASDQSGQFVVQLSFTSDGAEAFADATTRLSADHDVISIWLDDENISTATVNEPITDGNAVIEGDFTAEEVEDSGQPESTPVLCRLPFLLRASPPSAPRWVPAAWM